VSPCGFCLNWNVVAASGAGDGDHVDDDDDGASPEVLVGARGIRQGKVPKTDTQYRALRSRLSRASLARSFRVTMEATTGARSILSPPGAAAPPQGPPVPGPRSYRELKRAAAPPGYWMVRDELFRGPESPLSGWLAGGGDDDDGDFAL
jgi:hypothetical protein